VISLSAEDVGSASRIKGDIYEVRASGNVIMDTVFAETLLAVVETGSIAGASRKMGISPGAVALRIKALESEVGVPLLGRAGNRVAPTAAASRLITPLSDIVARTADLRHLASGRGTVEGELRVGAIATASVGMLPRLLGALRRSHPALDLFIVPGTSSELCEQVLDGVIDAAIVVEPPTPPRKGEVFAPWVEEPLVLIGPCDMADEDPLVLIEGEPFIRYDRRNWGGRIVDRWLKANGLQVHDRIELDALDGIVAMVSAGLGVSIIPDWAGPRPSGAVVKTVKLPEPTPVRCVGLFHRRVSPRQDLVALLTPAFRQMAGTRDDAKAVAAAGGDML
jgi:DNA-binding transcriptional LysR family regulator